MMKKRILSLLLSFALTLAMGSFCADAEVSFKVTPVVDYDNEKITITGVTPALYGQKISVVIYKLPSQISGMADVENRENPEPQFPLSVANIRKIKNVTADLEGNFTAEFNLGDLSADYYVVSAAGNGYKSAASKDSELIYFESVDSINNETIPAISAATADTIEPIIREKELLLGVDVAGDYEANKDVINALFESIKEDDYQGAYAEGEMAKIQQTFNSINLLREMYKTTATDELLTLIEKNNSSFGINLENEDFVGKEEEVARIYLNIIAEAQEKNTYKPRSMAEARTVFEQSMGVTALNKSTNSEITDVFNSYGELLGIDMEDYEASCEKYGAVEVNKAFVGRDFDVASQINDAYEACIENLKKPAGGGGGGGGGGSSSRPGNSAEYIGLSTELVDENIPKEEIPQKFSDVSEEHWAYEAVQALAEMGIVEGMGNEIFAPDMLVSREQFVKMLIEAGGYYDAELQSQFDDVEQGRWSSAYIASAVSRGIVTGTGDGNFKPEAELTRQDASVMAYRLANVMKKTLSKSDFADFTDASLISDYAIEAVATLASSSVLNGFEDGSFNPLGTLTRAQAAKIVFEILNK